MDMAQVILLIGKGLTVAEALMRSAQDASPAINALIKLVKDVQGGQITDEQLAATEALLDQLIEDFNVAMD